MTTSEIITAILIHAIIPLTGLLAYAVLIRRILKEKVDNPPVFELFLIFATYGGLLLVILTIVFWEWSGMASLGTLYLIIGAPIVMGIIAFRNYKTRHSSKYHRLTYMAGLFYFIPLAFMLLRLFEQ